MGLADDPKSSVADPIFRHHKAHCVWVSGWWCVVVFRPTPLKNEGVSESQLGWLIIPNWMEKSNSCPKPPTRCVCVFGIEASSFVRDHFDLASTLKMKKHVHKDWKWFLRFKFKHPKQKSDLRTLGLASIHQHFGMINVTGQKWWIGLIEITLKGVHLYEYTVVDTIWLFNVAMENHNV